MHIAALRGEYKIIKLLMLFGASPFIYTFGNGLTPLDYARESGKSESLNVLKPLFDEKNKTKQSKNNVLEITNQVNILNKIQKIICSFFFSLRLKYKFQIIQFLPLINSFCYD